MKSTIEALLEQAGRRQARGDLGSAEALLREALQHAPGQPDALHGLGLLCYQQGRMVEAHDLLRQAAAATPGNAVLHNNLGLVSRAVGDLTLAGRCYDSAIRLQGGYAEAWLNRGVLLRELGRLDAALADLEHALKLQPDLQAAARLRDELLLADIDPEELRDLTILCHGGEGLHGDFRDLAARLARARGGRRLLVVAAAPKSASTWFSNVLAAVTGYRYANLCYAFLQNEQDLYPPALLAWNRRGAVSQLHMRGTLPNARLLRYFGIRPVVLYRPLEDVVVSLYDQFRDRDWLRSRNSFSFAWIDESYTALGRDAQVDFIITHMLPWFIQFQVSWQRLERDGEVEPLWLDYDAVTSDPVVCASRALAANGLAVDGESIATRVAQLQQARTRLPKFNRGEAGRGREWLRADERRRIGTLGRGYPDYDLSAILPG